MFSSKPMKKDYEENTEEHAEATGIHGWFPRRHAGTGENKAMTVRPDSDYEWEVAVSFTFMLKENETPKSIGYKIARKFTAFAKTCGDVSLYIQSPVQNCIC